MTDLTSAAREFADKWNGAPENWSSMRADQYLMLAEFAQTYAESRTADLVAALKDARTALVTIDPPKDCGCETCGIVRPAITAIDKVLGGKHE